MTITAETNVAEFAPDVGSPIRRKRYTARRSIYSGDIAMNADQAMALLRFHEVDCSDGVKSFQMRDWVGDYSATFSWLSPPSVTKVGANIWRASLSLAREP